mmetsp:Transcript_32476/g.30958  ORF Transcript_32476/g.30958 Transcript_32476/m.30958 type:complete len:96 (+) Transcript_32476:75-362(+)
MSAVSGLRKVATQPVRKMCTGSAKNYRNMFDKKDNVREKRAAFYQKNTQGMAHPTYLKEPSDKYIMMVLFTGFVVGTSTCLWGLGSMAFGVNKVE